MVTNAQEVINKRLRKHFLYYTYYQPSLLLKIMRDNIQINMLKLFNGTHLTVIWNIILREQ